MDDPKQRDEKSADKKAAGITPEGTSASLPVDEPMEASPDEGGGHERHPTYDVNGDALPGADENNFPEDERDDGGVRR